MAKSIKAALTRLTRSQPMLAEHLRATVRCGHFCRYVPDPRAPIRWQVSFGAAFHPAYAPDMSRD